MEHVAAIRVVVSTLLLGAVGLLCGYFGPLQLSPDANQGPLLGIFFTGPIGFIVGLAFGVISVIRPMSYARFAALLLGLAGITAAGTLCLSLPEDRWQGFVIDGEVRDCQGAASAVPSAENRWQALNAETPWRSPRSGWESEIPGMLLRDNGVVVTVNVLQRWDIYEQRKPWNRGNLHAKRSRTHRAEKYFARGQDCQSSQLLPGYHSRYAPEWEASTMSLLAIM